MYDIRRYFLSGSIKKSGRTKFPHEPHRVFFNLRFRVTSEEGSVLWVRDELWDSEVNRLLDMQTTCCTLTHVCTFTPHVHRTPRPEDSDYYTICLCMCVCARYSLYSGCCVTVTASLQEITDSSPCLVLHFSAADEGTPAFDFFITQKHSVVLPLLSQGNWICMHHCNTCNQSEDNCYKLYDMS